MLKKHQWILFAIGLLGVVFIMFAQFILDGKVLLTTDAAIKGSNILPSELLPNLAYNWSVHPILGSSGASFCKLPLLIKLFIRGVAWNNWIYPIACAVSSIAFYIYLRKHAFRIVSIALGALAAFWIGSNFTLIFPGHIYKPYVVLFFVLSLIPAGKAGKGSISAGLVWGSCVGLMFVQQTDIAMFFALFSGAYLVFNLWKELGVKPVAWARIMVPAALVAFLFAAGPLLNGYNKYVKGAEQMQSGNKTAKWDYVTQWSWPPEESIAFVAPGYMGWRSGEPDGPYWGKMGRSADWETTGRGFQNFKLESVYIGIIPIGFALFSLISCRRSKHRAEILFWAAATVVALLLSFGKFFPLYALFYKLPVVNSIRNPNKFLQVFQVCLAILSVYGFDALFRRDENHATAGDREKTVRLFFWTSISVLAVLSLSALVASLGKEGGISQLVMKGWPTEAAEVIARNKAAALWHAVVMTAVLTAAVAVFSFKRFASIARQHTAIAVVLLLVVAGDAVKLSRHYLKDMPRSYIKANALTDFLRTNVGKQRVAFLSQDGINNIWITYLMPYNGITTFNYTDMPRMATDYKTLLTAGQRDPLGMWRFSAVKYLLASSGMDNQLSNAGCRKVFAYGLADAGDGEFRVVPDANGPLAVYELLNTLPRYALFAGSQTGSDQQALDNMGDFSKVILPEDSPLPALDGVGQTGTVEILSYRDGKVKLRVNTQNPAILRCADRYDSSWEASVDGKPQPVNRVDFLCQGVFVPAGEHEVLMKYAPSHGFFYMQCAGYLILATAMTVPALRRKGRHGTD